jgi:hypothetical protein
MNVYLVDGTSFLCMYWDMNQWQYAFKPEDVWFLRRV